MLLALFVWVEARTTAIPVIPLRQLRGRNPIAIQTTNVCAGTAAYAYLFMLPLFFQVVLKDSATKAGARLAIPSLATPIGGIIAGVVMSRWGKLLTLVKIGAVLMTFGNGLVTSLSFYDSTWKYLVFIFPANLGQGIIYPATLFTTLASFDHSGKLELQSLRKRYRIYKLICFRPCRIRINSLPHPIARQRMGCRHHRSHCPKHAKCKTTKRISRYPKPRRGEILNV
jgi:hypothetical protein